jgi:hypothetical protein
MTHLVVDVHTEMLGVHRLAAEADLNHHVVSRKGAVDTGLEVKVEDMDTDVHHHALASNPHSRLAVTAIAIAQGIDT